MKLKRTLAWLLVLVMCFALMGCTEEGKPNKTTKPKPTSTATPLLYRVTDGSGNVVWLFGSIHVGRESYYPLPKYVQSAFDDADALAVELDIVAFEKDTAAQTQALASLIYVDGTTIRDRLDKDLYDDAVAIMEHYGSYMPLMDVYKPAFWASMIQSLMMQDMDADVELGVDRHLLERAKAAKKEILEIESAELQYHWMAGFSLELQTLLLKSAVQMYQNPEASKADLQNMMDLWASGDEAAFAAYLATSDANMTPAEQALYEEYNEVMIDLRNQDMADYAEAALLSGEEVFICVGAAHVVGEGAMADLLAQRGYSVELVTK